MAAILDFLKVCMCIMILIFYNNFSIIEYCMSTKYLLEILNYIMLEELERPRKQNCRKQDWSIKINLKPEKHYHLVSIISHHQYYSFQVCNNEEPLYGCTNKSRILKNKHYILHCTPNYINNKLHYLVGFISLLPNNFCNNFSHHQALSPMNN